MNSLSSIAVSGLSAASLRLDTSANNIANAQTLGYRRRFVMQDAQDGGGVATTIGQSPQTGSDLAGDLVEQMSASYSFKANLRVIQTHDKMMGALLDAQA